MAASSLLSGSEPVARCDQAEERGENRHPEGERTEGQGRPPFREIAGPTNRRIEARIGTKHPRSRDTGVDRLVVVVKPKAFAVSLHVVPRWSEVGVGLEGRLVGLVGRMVLTAALAQDAH